MPVVTDIRYNNYHIINHNDEGKWSTDWHEFPGVPMSFWFEDLGLIYGDYFHQLQQDYWHISFGISFIYLLLIFSLKKLMSTRKPFNLRSLLACWSCLMTIFSIFGVARCLPEFVHVILTKGFDKSFCDSSYYLDIRLNLWYWLFIMAKVVELGDTFFIVLRKKKLTKLHLIHHSTSLIFSWYVFGDVPGTARWMVNMNFIIHSIMYGYYTIKALGINVPKPIALSITTSQIIQMLIGFYINIKAYHYKIVGLPCDLSTSVATTGALLYICFFILFLNYFIKTYIIDVFILTCNKKSIKFIEEEEDEDTRKVKKID